MRPLRLYGAAFDVAFEVPILVGADVDGMPASPLVSVETRKPPHKLQLTRSAHRTQELASWLPRRSRPS